MDDENITLAPLIVVKHRTTMKLLKISLITSVTLFFATNYAEAQTASGGTDEYTTEEFISLFGLIIGLIGFFKLISMAKKDGRTNSGYKNNESPLRIKKRFIGLVMMVLGGAIIYLGAALTDETPVEKPTEPEVEKPAEQLN